MEKDLLGIEKFVGKRKSSAYSVHMDLTTWSRDCDQRSREIK